MIPFYLAIVNIEICFNLINQFLYIKKYIHLKLYISKKIAKLILRIGNYYI